MGMSTHVKGFKPSNGKWLQMQRIWITCDEAGIDPPEEVQKFFNYSAPDKNGIEVSESELILCGAVKKYQEEGYSGFDIDTTKLPKDVVVLRFYNSF